MDYTPAQQRELARRYQQARAAGSAEAGDLLAELLASVEKLARMLAQSRHQAGLTEWEDLLADARMDLIEAAAGYDPDGVAPFGTYAAGVLRISLAKSLASARRARNGGGTVPLAWGWVRRQAAAAAYNLEQRLGRKPTTHELRADLTAWAEEWATAKLTAEQSELPADEKLALARQLLRKQGTLGAIERLDQVMLLSQPPTQLDQPLGGDGWSTVGDLIASPASTEQDALAAIEAGRVRAVLACLRGELSPAEQLVLDNMLADAPRNQPELAAELGVSRQAVSLNQQRLEARLRHPVMLRRLRAAAAS